MNKTIVAVLAVAVFMLVCVGLYSFRTPTIVPEKKVDPLNASYRIDTETASLVKGSAETPVAPGSATKAVTQVFGVPVFGDINGDGTEDAVLLLQRQTGGSGVFYYVAAALSESNTTVGLNAEFIGDRIAPQGIGIRSGVVVVNYASRKVGQPMTAAPSVGVSKYFVVHDRFLVEVVRSNDYLQVSEPAPMQIIQNPVLVTGFSNFFEANTRIRVLDGSGTILADTATTALGWMNKLYPFSASVSYQPSKTVQGTVEVFESSAKDGSDVHKVSIPVLFR